MSDLESQCDAPNCCKQRTAERGVETVAANDNQAPTVQLCGCMSSLLSPPQELKIQNALRIWVELRRTGRPG